jgi:hypothetical protein
MKRYFGFFSAAQRHLPACAFDGGDESRAGLGRLAKRLLKTNQQRRLAGVLV